MFTTSSEFVYIIYYTCECWTSHDIRVARSLLRSGVTRCSLLNLKHKRDDTEWEMNRRATRVGTFEVCVPTYVELCRIQLHFWPIETVKWLFCHYSGRSITSKVGGHVQLLSGPQFISYIVSIMGPGGWVIFIYKWKKLSRRCI